MPPRPAPHRVGRWKSFQETVAKAEEKDGSSELRGPPPPGRNYKARARARESLWLKVGGRAGSDLRHTAHSDQLRLGRLGGVSVRPGLTASGRRRPPSPGVFYLTRFNVRALQSQAGNESHLLRSPQAQFKRTGWGEGRGTRGVLNTRVLNTRPLSGPAVPTHTHGAGPRRGLRLGLRSCGPGRGALDPSPAGAAEDTPCSSATAGSARDPCHRPCKAGHSRLDGPRQGQKWMHQEASPRENGEGCGGGPREGGLTSCLSGPSWP